MSKKNVPKKQSAKKDRVYICSSKNWIDPETGNIGIKIGIANDHDKRVNDFNRYSTTMFEVVTERVIQMKDEETALRAETNLKGMCAVMRFNGKEMYQIEDRSSIEYFVDYFLMFDGSKEIGDDVDVSATAQSYIEKSGRINLNHECDFEPGLILYFRDSTTGNIHKDKKVKVTDDGLVEYKGEKYHLSNLAHILGGYKTAPQGSRHFVTENGETVQSVRDRIRKKMD